MEHLPTMYDAHVLLSSMLIVVCAPVCDGGREGRGEPRYFMAFEIAKGNKHNYIQLKTRICLLFYILYFTNKQKEEEKAK